MEVISALKNVSSTSQLQPLHEFITSTEWTRRPRALTDFSRGMRREIVLKVGSGSGQSSAPFSLTPDRFVAECETMDLSPSFLRKLSGKRAMFEHLFTYPQHNAHTNLPTHLEIAIATFENDAFLMLLRYDLVENRAWALVFLKTWDHLTDSALSANSLFEFIDKQVSILIQYPLLMPNFLISFVQSRSQSFVKWRVALNDMKSKLGVTGDSDVLQAGGYAPVSYDYNLLNAKLSDLASGIADTVLNTQMRLELAKDLLRLASITEQYQRQIGNGNVKDGNFITSPQFEEIKATITRAELFLVNMEMAQNVMHSLATVLYNRINKHDSQSMKTIAVLTLFFLPATFVSSIFSTGIFNFHANEGEQPRVISQYGWVYLVICLIATLVTLIFWASWYHWGRFWLERLQLAEAYPVKQRK